MDHRAQRIHRKKLRRAARQKIRRQETFVAAHGNSEYRRTKNLLKYPSLAEPDKRPSIRCKDWTPKPEPEPEKAENKTD